MFVIILNEFIITEFHCMIKQDSKLFSLRYDSTAERRNYLLRSDSWFASQIRRTNGPQIGFLREEFGILDKIFVDGYL